MLVSLELSNKNISTKRGLHLNSWSYRISNTIFQKIYNHMLNNMLRSYLMDPIISPSKIIRARSHINLGYEKYHVKH